MYTNKTMSTYTILLVGLHRRSLKTAVYGNSELELPSSARKCRTAQRRPPNSRRRVGDYGCRTVRLFPSRSCR